MALRVGCADFGLFRALLRRQCCPAPCLPLAALRRALGQLCAFLDRNRGCSHDDIAVAAAGVGLRRSSHARLPPPRDNHTVRRTEHGERHRAQPVPTPPSASGISGLPAADRRQRAGGAGRAPHRGQLTPRTSIRGSNDGWRHDPASKCTAPSPMLPGSTKSRSGATSSPGGPSAGEPSAASNTWWPASTSSCAATIRRRSRSSGRPPPIPSWENSADYVNVFPGHDTRAC